MINYKAEVCLEHSAALGEGPLWDGEAKELMFVDILGSQLHRFDPVSQKVTSLKVEEHISTVVKKKTGGLMITCRDGFYSLDEKTAKKKAWTLPTAGDPLIRFNDGKCDPAGRFWAGTMAYDTTPGAGKLFCLEPDGTLLEKLSEITISNGICWSKDKMYYIDSATKQISVYDYRLETGDMDNRKTLFEVGEEGGFPDGMCLDDEGCLWVAFWGESLVRRISPEGQELARVQVDGASQVSACALGGHDGSTLFITTAAVGIDLEQEPNAGKLFSVQVDAKGAPSYVFGA
jgi:sugar lactone lactonase YvrE